MAAALLLKSGREMKLFNFKRNKAAQRFYLLPGQGGTAYRRKQRFILTCAVIVGLALAAILGVLMYFLDKPKL
jgi:hypothetical protein